MILKKIRCNLLGKIMKLLFLLIFLIDCEIITFFPDSVNLFNESDAINEMAIVNDVLESERILYALDKVKDQSAFIKAYTKLMDAIRKTGSHVRFITASPNSTKSRKISLTKDVVAIRYNEMKDVYRI